VRGSADALTDPNVAIVAVVARGEEGRESRHGDACRALNGGDGILALTNTKSTPSSAADVLAGITLAAVAIPECMGYTKIVGTPVVTGLYTMLLPTAMFAWLGSSRHLVVGADSATAAMLFAGLSALAAPFSPHWLTLTSIAALLTAAVLVAAALLRLGFLADFLSRTVLVGFLSGVGVSLMIGQLPEMLGVEVHASGFLPRFIATLTQVPSAHLPTVLVAVGVLVVIAAAERFRSIPGPLVAVGLAILSTWLFRLDRVGVAIVGRVPAGLPALGMPTASGDEILALLPTVASMFLVIVAQSAATARSFAQKYDEPLNENRDLLALAAANALAAVSGTFVVNGSPTKTAIVDAAGARSQLAQVTTAGVVVVVLLVATALLAWLPVAGLAALVFVIGVKLVNVEALRQIHRFRKVTFAVAVGTLAAVVLLGVERGIFVAITLSVLDHLRQEYQPKDVVLITGEARIRLARADAGVESEPGLVIYRFEAPLFFANADYFAARVQDLVRRAPHAVRWFVFDLVSTDDIDFTGGLALVAKIQQLQQQGIIVALADGEDVREDLDRIGALHHVAPDHLFESVQDAVEVYRHL
jgi:high affinity sulfate transporter 1